MVIVSNEWTKNYADDQKINSEIDRNILMMAAPPPPPSYPAAAAVASSSSSSAAATTTTTTDITASSSAATVTAEERTSELIPSSLPSTVSSFSSILSTIKETTTTPSTVNIQKATESTAESTAADTEFLVTSTMTTFQSNNHLTASSNNNNNNHSNKNNSSHDIDSMIHCSETSSLSSTSSSSSSSSSSSARIILLCEANSHPFQTRTITLKPNVECKVGRLIAKSKASETNAIFDCKVLSRNHAVLWFGNDNKFYVKDTKSSNGTFINDTKLLSDEAELRSGDIVKFGVDVMENSRKEVHGCIIACVKLYLPDGREAISIDQNHHQYNSQSSRSQYTGERRISFDEMHRLNLYMQETTQREKMLKSKLYNIQNILDVTRKNSLSCWQSMICEDQLLHRIHLLERKLQFMEKNAPENTIRDEMFKLLDDKCLYQHSAKEALRKVYQERCDAMQMLSKMENAYTNSENECKILREQILNTKQNLQDVNGRLLHLEEEYHQYKEETKRLQQEAKQQELQQINDLIDKLREREIECEEYKHKISELLLKRAELLEKYQDQMMIDENYDRNCDDELVKREEKNENNDNDDNADADERDNYDVEEENAEKINEQTKSSSSPMSQQSPSLPSNMNSTSSQQQQVAKNSTILKWLKNSDLMEKEGSLDIFKAICNESDSGDESGTGNGHFADDNKDFVLKCTKLDSKLQNVQKNLIKLEADIVFEINQKQQQQEQLQQQQHNQKYSKLEAVAEEEEVVAETEPEEDVANDDNCKESSNSRNGRIGDYIESQQQQQQQQELQQQQLTTSSALLANDNFFILQSSVLMLREAFNELSDHMTSMKNMRKHFSPRPPRPSQPPPPQRRVMVSVETQFQKISSNNENQRTTAIDYDDRNNDAFVDEEDDDDDDDDEDDDKDETNTTTSISSFSTTIINDDELKKSNQKQNQSLIIGYEKRIDDLQKLLTDQQTKNEITIDKMQSDCVDFENKIAELTKLIEMLREDKQSLEKILNENKSNQIDVANDDIDERTTIDQNVSKPFDVDYEEATMPSVFETQIREESAVINSDAVQREEELILYKERLETIQNENIQLRNELNDFKLKGNLFFLFNNEVLIKKLLTYGAIFIAIILYFIISYF